MKPKNIPERCARFPVLSKGFPERKPMNPIMSPIAQATPAKRIGIGIPKAQTGSKGFMAIIAAIIPKIAPDAPRDEL